MWGGDGLRDVGGAASTGLRVAAVGDLLNTDPGLELEAGQRLAEAEGGGGRAVVRRHGALHGGAGGGRGGAEQQLVPLLHGGAVGAAQPPAQGARAV